MGAPDLAALEPGTSSGRLRTSVATSSPPGPTDPGLIALLAEIQTLNQAMIQRLDALEGRTAQQGPQEAVNAAVDQVLQSLTGTLAPNPTVPVDIHVPDKIRQKTLQDEFVDFAILLQRQKGDMVYTLAVDSQSGQPNMVLAPQSKKTKLLFTRWVEAWNIFVCMYVTGHPENVNLTPALAQHFQVVCDHFHKGQDWEYYDSQFRLLREKGLVQWGEKHYDTSFEAKDRGRPAPPPQQKSEACQSIVPKGFCRAYHNFGRCQFDKCSFSHKCYNAARNCCSSGQPFCGQPGASGRVPQTGGNRATHLAGKNTGQHNTASHPARPPVRSEG